jgi:hypothetical protein
MKKILLMATATLMAASLQAQGVIDLHAHIITPSFLSKKASVSPELYLTNIFSFGTP